MADNLLTSVVRAWDTTGEVDGIRKKIIVAPSMNVAMWLHPVTAPQIQILEKEWLWFEVLVAREEKNGLSRLWIWGNERVDGYGENH